MAHKVHRANVVCKASKDLRVFRVRLVQLVHKVHKENKVFREKLVP